MNNKKKRTHFMDVQFLGLTLLAAITSFVLSLGYFYLLINPMGMRGSAGPEYYLAMFTMLCLVGGGGSVIASLITIVYLYFLRNKFPVYVNVSISLVFGLVSAIGVINVLYYIDLLL